MDVKELVKVLQSEIGQARDELEPVVDTLASAADGDPALAEAAQGYANQVERMSTAAEFVGLAGLANACMQVKDAALALAGADADARRSARDFLIAWPSLVCEYLNEPTDFVRSEALVAQLSEGPPRLSAAEGVSLMQALAAPPQLPAELMQESAVERARVATPEDVVLDVPPDVDSNVYGAFIDDAPQQVARLAELTDLLARHEAQAEELAEAKRIFHTFKGTANIIGIRGIATIAHHSEDLLEFLVDKAVEAPPELSRTLSDAAACLDQMVYALLGREDAPADAIAVLQRLLDWANRIDTGQIDAPPASAGEAGPASAAAAVPAREPGAAAASPEGTRAPAPPSGATFRVPVATVDEMMRLIGDLATRLGEAQENLSVLDEHARDLLSRQSRVQRRMEEIEDIIDLRGLALQRQAARSESGEFDSLEMDRYNELHGSTHALLEETVDTREIALRINEDLQRISNALHGQQYAHRDLQHLVLGTRLAPVATIVPRLNRNVRQTCQATGKAADLIAEGGDLAVDAEVLNQLADPLLHILRNAVDHGIESPDERVAAGKARAGRLSVEFLREGEGISVRCTDDGRGLDFDSIRAKAIERGLIAPDQTLTERELAHLILLPGFSTRDAVTEISGRGVGMDVVAERVRAMKGTVSIASRPGEGTIVEMRVQASLSMVHALLVDVEGATYAVPAQHAEFALFAGEASAEAGEDGEPRLLARDEVCQVRRLADLIMGAGEPLTVDNAASKPAIVVRSGEHLVAALVDRVHEARNIVLKSTGRYLSLLRGLAGVSVAHTGQVLPLLDLPELLADPALIRLASEARSALDPRFLQRKSVLIADDSLSVRGMLRELVEDAGFDALTARDGAEAWNMIRDERPDLLLTDLEMPNMNGLQLTTAVRSDAEFASMPVIMISSRSMDKHRQQAAEAGVNVYVTKPYSEVELVEIIRKALGAEVQPADQAA